MATKKKHRTTKKLAHKTFKLRVPKGKQALGFAEQQAALRQGGLLKQL